VVGLALQVSVQERLGGGEHVGDLLGGECACDQRVTQFV
jgi:hypothetical protein